MSLDNLGEALRGQGEWEKAQPAFVEVLGIARRLAAILPSCPEYRELPHRFADRVSALVHSGARWTALIHAPRA